MAPSARLRAWADRVKADAYALYLAYGDPRVPWYARLLVGAIVAYALSPIDLIPDFIPVIGYVDDLLLLPAGIALAVRLIPQGVLEEHRAAARLRLAAAPPRSRLGAVLVLAIWILLGFSLVAVLARTRGWRA